MSTQPAQYTVEEVLPEDEGPGRLVRISESGSYAAGETPLKVGDVLVLSSKEEQ
jgi:hypothetical protein